jgi:hypothetical protein
MKWIASLGFICVFGAIDAKEPRLSCEHKWGQVTWEGLVLKRYQLRAHHFPPGEQFHLVVKSFDGMQTETFTYEANQRGHLILKPVDHIQGEIYAICPLKRGERLTFYMLSDDKTKQYASDVIAFPIEMKSRREARLSMELMGEEGERFLLKGESFDSRELLEVRYRFGTEEERHEINASEWGTIEEIITVPSTARALKQGKVIIKRKREEITFPFNCNQEALKIVGACCIEIRS